MITPLVSSTINKFEENSENKILKILENGTFYREYNDYNPYLVYVYGFIVYGDIYIKLENGVNIYHLLYYG